jgi:hypothetical protein
MLVSYQNIQRCNPEGLDLRVLKVANKYFEDLTTLIYLEKAVTSQRYIHEDVQSKLIREIRAVFQFRMFYRPVFYLKTKMLK